MSRNTSMTTPKGAAHGIYSWLKTGRINPSIRGHKKLQAYLMKLERTITEDLGGPDNLTAAQEILIKATVEAYGVILLASMFCKRTGYFRPDQARLGVMELQPVLGAQFLAFMNTTRQNLTTLYPPGLGRRAAEKFLNPLELAKVIDAEKAAEKGKPGNGRDKVAGGPGNGQPCEPEALGGGFQSLEEGDLEAGQEGERQ